MQYGMTSQPQVKLNDYLKQLHDIKPDIRNGWFVGEWELSQLKVRERKRSVMRQFIPALDCLKIKLY